jgi:hypothetical protein
LPVMLWCISRKANTITGFVLSIGFIRAQPCIWGGRKSAAPSPGDHRRLNAGVVNASGQPWPISTCVATDVDYGPPISDTGRTPNRYN